MSSDDLSADVIVIGAGIVGLASAHGIARTGRTVVVLDPEPGSGATRAAGGMICPGAEASPEDTNFARETVRARGAWPAFADQIGESSKRPLNLAEVGSLFVALDSSDAPAQRRIVETAASQGVSHTVVTRDDHPDLFAGLSSRLTSGQFVADDAHVDPDAVVGSLLDCLAACHVKVVRERVLRCSTDESGVSAVSSSLTVRARCGIVATGVPREPLDIVKQSRQRVRPVRGVTVHLRQSPRGTRPMVRGLVGGRGVYVIPRLSGDVVIGATSDESWEAAVPAWAVRQLLGDAVAVMPELDEATYLESRVGLRPAPGSHSPFFDVLDEGLWAWSGGYYRHGFLLAPLAAERAARFAETAAS